MSSHIIFVHLIHKWLCEHTPELADGWELNVPSELKAYAFAISTNLPRIGDVLVGQAVLARTIMEHFELVDVALLGAGLPTPLSPAPADVRFFTNSDENIVEMGRHVGYNALQVDVTDNYDVQLLKGADVAIGTDLFHFLMDDDFRQAFDNFTKAGFRTIFFNHVLNTELDEMTLLQNQIMPMTPRTPNEIDSLLPAEWHIVDRCPMMTLLQEVEVIGDHLQGLPNLYNVYVAERR